MNLNRVPGGRAGHTLPELVVALLLAGIVGAAVLALLTSSTQAVRQLLARSDQAEVRRTVAALLHEELSVGVAGRDWSVEGDRAVRLRAFRGYARVCSEDGSTLTVAWRGQRLPDPIRDSVLVLAADGRWHPLDLAWEGAPPEPARCGPLAEEGILRERAAGWRLSGAVPGGVPLLLRYFEQGRYSLEDRAFRYRQGTGGRQPLTPDLVAASSRMSAVSMGGDGGEGSEGSLGGATGQGALGVELHLLVPRGTGGSRVPPPEPDRWVVRGDPAGPLGRPWP
jgi:hypothetical protein